MAEKTQEKKPSVPKRIAKYFRSIKSEIKKIVWPTPKQTTKNMGIVVLVIVLVGVFVFALDVGLNALLELVMDTAGQ